MSDDEKVDRELSARGQESWRKSKAHLPPEARKGRPPGPGRPSGYQPEYAERVYHMALLGATDEQLANCFGVHEATIYRWMDQYPEFHEARKRGGAEADARVAASLYHRAIGYTHPEEKIKITDGGKVFRAETLKHYPPDTGAASHWLRMRQPDVWKDKTEIEISSPEMRRLMDRMDQWPDDAIARLGAGEAPELVVKAMKAEVVRGLLTGPIEDAEIVEDPLSAEQDD